MGNAGRRFGILHQVIAPWLAAVPVACVGWGLVEAKLYHVRQHAIPVLPPGHTLSILQVSDLHLRESSRRLARFVESLASVEYDLVFATGDLLGEPRSVARCADILNRLRARHGRFFVLGSSDYYAPKFKNYLDYFLGRRRHGTRRNPTRAFTDMLAGDGWQSLSNAEVTLAIDGLTVQITGLDDPYLKRDDRSLLRRKAEADISICVVHDPAPYIDAARAGYDLQISGHTHGGQVRFPLIGAVVTNSSIPRRLARWSNRIDRMWLFVNPGLGTGRYAPFRFLSRPEASVLELEARHE